MTRPPPRSTLSPRPPLSRSEPGGGAERHPDQHQHGPAAPGGGARGRGGSEDRRPRGDRRRIRGGGRKRRSEEHTSELQSRQYLVCRLLLEKKKKIFHLYLRA